MEYCMNAGQYVLHDETTPIGAALDSVAIAFDRESGTLHKHGQPELVRAWHSRAQNQFRAAGFAAHAEALVVIEGRFLLEDLNRCLSTSGYVRRMYQQFVAGTLPVQP